MNIIGKWKIKEFHLPTPMDERDYTSEDPSAVVRIYTPETLPDGEEYEDFAQMARTFFEFTPDGRLDTVIPVPEDMYEQAKEEGMEIRDGFAVINSTTWKEQDGRFFYDSRIEGEILGEAVDPFMEIKVLPDGCLLYNMDALVLEPV